MVYLGEHRGTAGVGSVLAFAAELMPSLLLAALAITAFGQHLGSP